MRTVREEITEHQSIKIPQRNKTKPPSAWQPFNNEENKNLGQILCFILLSRAVFCDCHFSCTRGR